MQKSAILYLTNTLNKSIISEYNALNKAVQKQDHVSFLYDCSDKLPDELKDFHYHGFRFEDLKQHGLPLYNEHSVVPGNTHLPLVDFYLNYPDYKYYWVIESDVRFAGKWKRFFDVYAPYSEDLLTSHIRWYHEEPQWPRWDMEHPVKKIKTTQRLRSFNPIYRISNEALAFLIEEFKSGWKGHYEITFPTLIFHSRYKLMDLGGDSVFTPDALRYKIYTSYTKDKKNLNYGTFRFRPPYYLYGLKRNHLYHPVKPWKAFVKHYRERVKTYI